MANHSYSLKFLSEFLSASYKGDSSKIVNSVESIEFAEANNITFLSNRIYTKHLSQSKAGIVVLRAKHLNLFDGNAIITENPYLAYAKISHLFDTSSITEEGELIAQSAVIHPSAKIDKTVTIGENVVIESGVSIAAGVQIGSGSVVGHGSIIGENTKLHRNVTLCHDVCIGSNTILHSNCVIGSDGFGNVFDKKKWHKIAQLGGVIIGDNVEIGAGTCIDRGTIKNTIIKDGARLDNLIQVAHNVVIGKHTAIAAKTGISGSTVIGDYCTIGGGCGFAGHIELTNNVMITGGSSIIKSILEPGSYASGAGDVVKLSVWKRNIMRFQRLDIILKELKNGLKMINKI